MRPYALLAGVFALFMGGLLARGLNLGFIGDVLDYAYHYDRLGTFGGMRWLVTEHLHRHLLAGLFSAPIAYLFPGQSAAWYAYAFAAHFACGVMVFALADAMLRGTRRYVSFAAALVFAFHALQAELNFAYPTSGHGNSALFLALLSLWLYLQYVRRGRQNRWWREWSLVTFVVAVATYEQTALFFLLHPLIAYFEDRARGGIGDWRRWLWRVALDSGWYPVFVAGYLYLLQVLFPPSNDLILQPDYVVRQIAGAIQSEFSPGGFVARLAPAFAGDWLWLTLAIGAGVVALVVGVAWRFNDHANREGTTAARPPIDPRVYLTVIGVAVMVVSILGVAPATWEITEHPRMIYPAAVGFALLLTGGLSLVLSRLPATIRTGILALVTAVLVGTGATLMFQYRDAYAAREVTRQEVLNAVKAAVPSWTGEPLPYILLVTDANPSSDLWLYAQDIRFPLLFDTLYGTTGIWADALYFDLDPALAPAPDEPGSDYNGQFIVTELEGIYSPLLPFQPIDPARLVIVEYDSATQTARVLDALPDDVVARANITEREDVEWQTNRGLIPSPPPLSHKGRGGNRLCWV